MVLRSTWGVSRSNDSSQSRIMEFPGSSRGWRQIVTAQAAGEPQSPPHRLSKHPAPRDKLARMQARILSHGSFADRVIDGPWSPFAAGECRVWCGADKKMATPWAGVAEWKVANSWDDWKGNPKALSDLGGAFSRPGFKARLRSRVMAADWPPCHITSQNTQIAAPPNRAISSHEAESDLRWGSLPIS